ncbi:DNA-binding MarR family transcriptional regulator [Arthrobacter pigmenti]|uniref:DNA-binding MarR family transcriptional regulator n=1 Tax=Arthrobacter pigmenti TaxID=271432 RepID=A0A846RMQ6_9MICC|nr:MarR family transcriptional regulator [Arthrobacter pigmenti]NJC21417.1 DNA-binding MarR family transcriptional regulator [Arthrobacter pigmenti]
MNDHVDDIIGQWQQQRPDLDVSPMKVIGRLSRISQHVERRLEENFARHGLDSGAFDVLATLRRAGGPCTLNPKDLALSSMITSSAVAQRLNRLQDRGLVSRTKSGVDGRGTQVSLTPQGRELVDTVLPAHLDMEHDLLSGMSVNDLRTLADLLKKLGHSLAV